MPKLTDKEIATLKLKLLNKIDEYLNEVTMDSDNKIGWVPDNIERLMTDAAFSVLETVNATNHFFESQDMLKE